MRSTRGKNQAPAISPLLLRWYSIYARRQVAKQFHAVRLVRGFVDGILTEQPVVVYLNHASWWDPLVGWILAERCFPGRPAYAAIEEAQLEGRRFFRKVGFFGLEPGTYRGAATFHRMTQSILKDRRSLLWLAPQGQVTDPRERPVQFMPGLGHLPGRFGLAAFMPLAIEYPFWQGRAPEALACFGPPSFVRMEHASWTPARWTELFEAELAAVQDRLALCAARQDPEAFETLLSSSSIRRSS